MDLVVKIKEKNPTLFSAMHECQECSKSFKRKDGMLRHQEKCADRKNKKVYKYPRLDADVWECRECDKPFKSHSGVRHHYSSIHSGKKLHCSCGATFRRKDFLSRHKRTACRSADSEELLKDFGDSRDQWDLQRYFLASLYFPNRQPNRVQYEM